MNYGIMCLNMTTPTHVRGTVVCGRSMAIIAIFSSCSQTTLEQVKIISTIVVKNVDKISCCLASNLRSHCEYVLGTSALLSRHIDSRCDVARPTPRGGERLDFVGQKNIKNEIINTHLIIITKQCQILIIHVNLEL